MTQARRLAAPERQARRGLMAVQDDRWCAAVAVTGRRSDLITAAAPERIADVRDALTDRLAEPQLRAPAAGEDRLRDRLTALSSPMPPER